jgi:Ca2+-transporting ATPase
MNTPSSMRGAAFAAGPLQPRSRAPASARARLGSAARRVRAILDLAVKRFLETDAAQWAAAFAFKAFFSLFPLIVLIVTIASLFVDRERAGNEVIAYLEGHILISVPVKQQIVETIAGVIRSREQASTIAALILLWTSLQCFITLLIATNRSWRIPGHNWWRLPLKSLVLLISTSAAVLLGLAVPLLLRMATAWLFPTRDFSSWMYGVGSFLIPSMVVFLGLCLFYRLAPRRPTRLSEVWAAALCATVLLRVAEALFVIYLRNFSTLNAVYGAFGGVMALLLWIYVTGCIIIFGACLCAAQAETRPRPAVKINRFARNAVRSQVTGWQRHGSHSRAE